MHRINQYFFYAIFLFYSALLPAKDKNKLTITSIAPRSHVYTITGQGDDLWFGTACGAVLYNKASKAITYYDYRDGLDGNRIFDLEIDDAGHILAATNSGLFSFQENHWIKTIANDSLPSHYLKCMAKSNNGDLWCGTSNGIAKLAQDGSVQQFTSENTGLSSFQINDLFFDQEGQMWIAGNSCLTSHLENRWVNYGFESRYSVYDIASFDKNLVVASNLGLSIHNGSKWKTVKKKNGYWLDNIHAICFLEAGKTLIGGKNFLAIAEMSHKGELTHLQMIDNNISVEAIYLDQDNQIWLATETGVKYKSGTTDWQELEISNGMEQQNVAGLYHDGKTLWIGGDKGLYAMIGLTCRNVSWDGGDRIGDVTCLCGINDSTIYFVADDYLGKLKDKLALKIAPLKDSIIGEKITKIKNYDNKIYCSSAKGLAFFADGVWSLVTNEYDVRDFIYYKKSLWLATSTGAIEMRKHTNLQYFSKNAILKCIVERNGALWFGGLGGLYYFKGNAKSRRDLVDSSIKGLDISSDGIIYGCSDKGVFVIDENSDIDWQDFYDGQKIKNKQKVKWLTSYYGLAGTNMTAISHDKLDNIWLGAWEGISCLKITK